MMADNRRTAMLPGRLLWPARAALALLMLVAPLSAHADSPAIEVNPKALDAVPLPPPKPKPKPEKPAEVASLPPAASETAKKFEGRHERILFTAGQDALSAEAIETLSKLATDLTGNDQRIELSAYAGKQGESLSDANRLALKHALLVRDYLIGKGIAESRVLVRALGPAETGPADRVDIAFLTQ
jgi:outer membrane protein OmpA-like peptidoglycan-associated protein